MKHIRIALPLTLTLLLAACGGNGPTPTPPAPPVEQPPAPPVAPPEPTPGVPDVPGEGVIHYGEWGWNFQGNESYEAREGRFSIIERVDPDSQDQSYGLFQFCYSQCYDDPEGYAAMGIDDESKLTITLFRLSSTNDLVPLFEATDADGELVEDDQGRLVFEGKATAFEEFGDEIRGTFRAVFIADAPALAFAP